MSAEKVLNYTMDQVEILKEKYTSAQDDAARKLVVDNLANTWGKSKQSVIGKLVKEGVYLKPSATNKNGGPIEKKEAYLTALQAITCAPEGMLDSFEKANKTSLKWMVEFLIRMSDQKEANKQSHPNNT